MDNKATCNELVKPEVLTFQISLQNVGIKGPTPLS